MPKRPPSPAGRVARPAAPSPAAPPPTPVSPAAVQRDRLQRVLPACCAWPLHDVTTSRAIEQRARESLPPGTLMRRAGLAVARLAVARWPHARRIWIVAGPGGNGGDGLHAAAHLAAAGRTVAVTLLADAQQLVDDAAEGLVRARQAGVTIGSGRPDAGVDLVVDALLGLGAGRAPEGSFADAIQRMAATPAPCLAVDLPSGLAADTGAPLGDSVVRADACLALLTLKPGLFTATGRARSGEIWFDDLGVEALPAERPCARLSSPDDMHRAAPLRAHDTHKGSYGDAVVIGGAAGMLGAARLAAHGALAAGAGRTIVSFLDRSQPAGDTSRPEWLWADAAWEWDARRLAASTVICGCGGGDAVADALPQVLAHAGALVLDADALNVVAREPGLQTLLSDRASRGQATVLTPHPLEAARLLGQNTAQVQASRLEAAQGLARHFRAVVVLKGSGTVVAAPGTLPVLNSTGNAALASGGTGDVLAGWIGGLWAACRGTPSGPLPVWDLACRCATAAAWLHGEAADRFPDDASRARDLVDAMRRARRTSPSAP